MDSIQKFLRKLNKKERGIVIETILQIKQGNLSNLDIKKVQGLDNTFRVRRGVFRIKYTQTDTENIIIFVDRRNDNAY